MSTHTFPALDTNNAFTGVDTFTNVASLNQTLYVDGTQYPTVASAIAAVSASGTVIVPSGHTENISSTVNVGISGSKYIHLHIVKGAQLKITITNGTPGFIVGNGSSITGENIVAGGLADILVGASATISAAIINDQTLGAGQEYFGLSDLAIQAPSTANVNAMVDLAGVFVPSYIRNVVIDGCPAGTYGATGGIGLYLHDTVTAGIDCFYIENIWINGELYSGARPLVIKAVNGQGPTQIQFVGGAIEHQGASEYLAELNGNTTGISQICFYGVQFEGNTSNAGIHNVYIKDAQGVSFFGGRNTYGVASTAMSFYITESSSNLTSGIVIDNVVAWHGVVNTITNYTDLGTGGTGTLTYTYSGTIDTGVINNGQLFKTGDIANVITIDSGFSSPNSSLISFSDRGTSQYSLGKSTSGAFFVEDLNGNIVFQNALGGDTDINSVGANPVRIGRGNTSTTGMAWFAGTSSQVAGLDQSGNFTGNTLTASGATPTGTSTNLGLGTTTGVGNGSAGNVQAPAKSSGTGPTTPGTIVQWLEIDIGGTKYWLPLAQ